MRLPALIVAVLPAFVPTETMAQATLNKCIDAEGRVTYSNLPCRGAREVRKLEIDPPPPAGEARASVAPPPVATPAPPETPAAQPVPAAPTPPPLPASVPRPAAAPSPAQPRADVQRSASPAASAAPRTCEALTDQLGRVLDQMDAGQRQGASAQRMDAWNQQIRELERRKTEAGCF